MLLLSCSAAIAGRSASICCTPASPPLSACVAPFQQWGTPGAFPQLSVLSLDSNRINGTLPSIWGAPQAMQLLQEL